MCNSVGISVLVVALLLSLAAYQQDQGAPRGARDGSPQATDTTGSGARPKAGLLPTIPAAKGSMIVNCSIRGQARLQSGSTSFSVEC